MVRAACAVTSETSAALATAGMVIAAGDAGEPAGS
jgi:hypothetical protein